MFSLAFYTIFSFVITVFSCSPFVSLTACMIFHWMFMYVVFGAGTLSMLDYNLYYPLIMILWTLVGTTFCWMFRHDSLLVIKVSLENNYLQYTFRVVFAIVLMVCSTLPLELIGKWYAGLISIGLVLLSIIFTYYLLHRTNSFVFTNIHNKSSDQTNLFICYYGITCTLVVTMFWILFNYITFDQYYLSGIVGVSCMFCFAGIKFAFFGSNVPETNTKL